MWRISDMWRILDFLLYMLNPKTKYGKIAIRHIKPAKNDAACGKDDVKVSLTNRLSTITIFCHTFYKLCTE